MDDESRAPTPQDAALPPRWGFRRGTRNAGMALAALLWLACLALGGRRSGLDHALYAAFFAGDNAALARDAAFLTEFGRWFVVTPAALAAALLLYYKRRMRAALLLIVVFGGRLLVELQKVIVDRPRPGASPYLEALHSASFPSSHAANATITYVAIAFLLPVRQRNRAIAVGIALALALQVGWSRVALGAHWPTDVIGGWAFGLLWVGICMRLASERREA